MVWLDGIRLHKNYEIHIVDGKSLKSIIFSRKDIFGRYFPSSNKELIAAALVAWEIKNTLPDTKTIQRLVQGRGFDEYSLRENAFLYMNSRDHHPLLDYYLNPEDLLDYGRSKLVAGANCVSPILEDLKVIDTLIHQKMASHSNVTVYAHVNTVHKDKKLRGLYLISAGPDAGLEVFLPKKSELIWIRNISKAPGEELERADIAIRTKLSAPGRT